MGAQGSSAQPDMPLPSFFLLLQPVPPAKSRCPVCRDAINHYGDCCNPPSPGSGARLSTQQQVQP